MESNRLLLKTFTISLFFHIVGISLFSIIFPIPPSKTLPIEVTLLPPAMDKKIQLETTEVLPNLPALETVSQSEKLAQSDNSSEIVKISEEKFTGFPEFIPTTKITIEFEIPQFQVKFPPLPSIIQQAQSEIRTKSNEIIEGPIGERKLIYKEPIEYPDWAEKNSIEGNIKIKFWVKADGKISETEIITSSGYPELDVYTMNKFMKYLFQPINKNEDVWGIITFIFRLK